MVELVMRLVDPIRNVWGRREELGASLVEYALLLALIAVVAIVALHFLGGSVSNTLNSVGSSINNP
ncbi:MAG TPA: Flp family type IVb pilin [Acidimicrobiales bacterium]|nr:Flp family type IVb pilin [Acidimicrobiales bacterium]